MATSQGEFRCVICDISFASLKGLRQHLGVRHKEGGASSSANKRRRRDPDSGEESEAGGRSNRDCHEDNDGVEQQEHVDAENVDCAGTSDHEEDDTADVQYDSSLTECLSALFADADEGLITDSEVHSSNGSVE